MCYSIEIIQISKWKETKRNGSNSRKTLSILSSQFPLPRKNLKAAVSLYFLTGFPCTQSSSRLGNPFSYNGSAYSIEPIFHKLENLFQRGESIHPSIHPSVHPSFFIPAFRKESKTGSFESCIVPPYSSFFSLFFDGFSMDFRTDQSPRSKKKNRRRERKRQTETER